MAKIVKELVTKWTYKVQATDLKKATAQIIKLKKKLLEVRKSSTAFGKQERGQLKSVGSGWKRATREVDRYRKAKMRASRASASGGGRRGLFGGGGGGRLAGGIAGIAGMGVLGSVATGAAGLGGLGVLGLGGAVGLAARKESIVAGIAGLLKEDASAGGSKPQTDALMAALDKFATETPFQLTNLRTLAGTLLAGGFAANEIVENLRMVGDVTRGNQHIMKRMLFNFIQVKSVGKASMIDLRQFAMANIPIFEVLKKQLGVTGDELADMTRKGQISFAIIKEAFRTMTGDGGRFQGSMRIQSEQLLGVFSNIKDHLELIGEAIGEELIADVTKLAKAFKEWLGDNKDGIVARVMNFVASMRQFKNQVVELAEKNEVFATSLKLVAGAMVILAARAHPVLAAFIVIAAVIDDINNGLRGNASISGDYLKAYASGGIGGVLSLGARQATEAVQNSTYFKNQAREFQTEMDRPALMLLLKTEADKMRASQDTMLGVGAMIEGRSFAPNQSLAQGSTNQSTFNQTNNISGDFAGQSVIDGGDDLFRLMKEEVRAKKAN